MREDELRREREMESVCDAEVERMWEKRVRQWKMEKMARQKLLDEVVEARRQQIQQRRTCAVHANQFTPPDSSHDSTAELNRRVRRRQLNRRLSTGV